MNHPALRIIPLLSSLLVAVGCAQPQLTMTDPVWNPPNDTRFAGVTNFGAVTTNLWRGSQPTAAGFRNLEQAGVKTVINLRYDHDDFEELRDTKLRYLRIPMRAWDPNQGDFAQLTVVMKTLERLLQDPSAHPIFIHCAQGRDRTGYAVATYRRLVPTLVREDALAEMNGYGFNKLWFRNPGHIRKLDLPRMRELMQRIP